MALQPRSCAVYAAISQIEKRVFNAFEYRHGYASILNSPAVGAAIYVDHCLFQLARLYSFLIYFLFLSIEMDWIA